MSRSDNNRITSGFPHSDIHGSGPVHGSPWLFAVYHVLHRLLLPRHPPNALVALDLIRKEQGSFSCATASLLERNDRRATASLLERFGIAGCREDRAFCVPRRTSRSKAVHFPLRGYPRNIWLVLDLDSSALAARPVRPLVQGGIKVPRTRPKAGHGVHAAIFLLLEEDHTEPMCISLNDVKAPALRPWWGNVRQDDRTHARTLVHMGSMIVSTRMDDVDGACCGRHWWVEEDLNLRPHAYQACALTT